MRQLRPLVFSFSFAIASLAAAGSASAQPTFVNGLVIAGDTLDATRMPGANGGRFGHFSDLYYDPVRQEWWALSDRGPGGGLHRLRAACSASTSTCIPSRAASCTCRSRRRSSSRIRNGLLTPPAAAVGDPVALNGLNPLLLNGNAAALGRSFDPEGLVVDPRTGHFIVADEYGPSVYEFSRAAA